MNREYVAVLAQRVSADAQPARNMAEFRRSARDIALTALAEGVTLTASELEYCAAPLEPARVLPRNAGNACEKIAGEVERVALMLAAHQMRIVRE